MKIINFSKAIEYFIGSTNNEKFVRWGLNNQHPQETLDLYYNIPEHASAISFIKKSIMGMGIQEIDYWTLDKIVLDYLIFGGFSIEVVSRRNGESSIKYVDISTCRLSKDARQVAVSDGWNTSKPNVNWYNLTDSLQKPGIYFFKGVNSRNEYPLPYYFSVYTSLKTMKSIIDYHNNNAANGFAPNVLINFNNGIPTEEVQEKIEKKIERKFTGEKGQKFVLMFNETKDTATTIEKLDNDNLDQRFETLQKFLQNQVIISHQITSGQLIGVTPENQGFSKTEFEEAFQIFDEVVVKSLRNEILYGLKSLTGSDYVFIEKQVKPQIIPQA